MIHFGVHACYMLSPVRTSVVCL